MRRRMLGRTSGGSAPLPDVFTFKTVSSGAFSFSIEQSGIEAFADLGDGNGYVLGTNTSGTTWEWSTTYSDSTEKTVSVSVQDFADVTGLGDFSAKDITEFDASMLNELNGTVNFSNNTELTTWDAPSVHDAVLFELNLSNCGIETVDVSALNISNNLFLHNNSTLTGFTVGSGIQARQIFAYDCNLTGNLDFSPITNINSNTGRIDISRNPLLTSFTQPSSQITNPLTLFYIDNCDITGVLDISNFFPGGIRNFRCNDNPNLTGLGLPADGAVTTALNVWNLHNCNITGSLSLGASTIGWTGVFGAISLDNNENLTSLTFASGQSVTVRDSGSPGNYIGFSVVNTGLSILDLSPLTKFEGSLVVAQNSSLSQIITSTGQATRKGNLFIEDNPSLGGTLELDKLNIGGTSFVVSNNGNITNINFPNGVWGAITVKDTDCTSFDMDGMINGLATTDMDFTDNLLLEDCILPKPDKCNSINFSGCANLVDLEFSSLFNITGNWPNKNNARLIAPDSELNVNSVNNLLETYKNAALPLASGGASIDLRGGTNATPTAGPPDGIAAKASINGITGHTALTN